MKKKILDLFCGAGGAAMGYYRAGFEVVGVDIYQQPHYPFEFEWADALDFLRTFDADGFAGIHASPPCQAYSTRTPDPRKHPALISQVRKRLKQIGLPYVIENVLGAQSELKNPVMLCGSAFGLRVQRHRLFEANWPLIGAGCEHHWQEEDKRFLIYDHRKWSWKGHIPVHGSGGSKAAEYWPFAMGCGDTWDDCWMTRNEIQEAIPPAYTEYVGAQLQTHLEKQAVFLGTKGQIRRNDVALA